MAIKGSVSKGVTVPKKIVSTASNKTATKTVTKPTVTTTNLAINSGPPQTGLPPMSYSQAAGGTANPMNVYQMQAAMQNANITKATTFGTPSPAGPVMPYITSTPAEYNAAAAMANDFQNQLGLKGDMGGPPMSYTGGAYPGYTPPQVTYPTAPTSGYFSSQAPDTRVYTPKPYDTPETWEYAAAKAMADAAAAAKAAAGAGGGSGGYLYYGGGGGGGGGGGVSNWSTGAINWRI